MSLSSNFNIKLIIFTVTLGCLGLAVYGGAVTQTPGDIQSQLQSSQISKVNSIDGKYAVYIRHEQTNNAVEVKLGHVWLENLQSKQRWQLTPKARPFVGLTLTPDGQSLTFLSRESQSDTVATFDINFDRGLASVHYNQLLFKPGQIIAMPMWRDEDKLVYISRAQDNTVSLMQWSSSRGNHKLIRRYDEKMMEFADSPASGKPL